MDDAGDAPEILGQAEPARLGELGPPVAEDRWLGATESVDRLLDVADHEEPSREELRAAEQPEDLALEAIGVLELVDEHEFDRQGIGGFLEGATTSGCSRSRLRVMAIRSSKSRPRRRRELLVLDADDPREPGESQALAGRGERARIVPFESGLDAILDVIAERR